MSFSDTDPKSNAVWSTLLTGVAAETGRAGAASVDGVAGAAVNTGAGLIAAVAVETWEAHFKKKKEAKQIQFYIFFLLSLCLVNSLCLGFGIFIYKNHI